MVDKAFGKVVKRLRTERSLSQETLAFEADMHRTYISQLERGLKSPSLRTILKLAQVLAVDLKTLMGLVEEEMLHVSSNRD
jgi:transcriptional regulator with XRE-family HTH domain